jgi:hypothetical protein
MSRTTPADVEDIHMPDIVDDILMRLQTLEAVVLGGKHGGVDARFDRRLGKREMAMRRGTSTRTLERDVKRGRVLQPEIDEYGHWLWWLSEVQQDERERAAVAHMPAPAPASRKRKPPEDREENAV